MPTPLIFSEQFLTTVARAKARLVNLHRRTLAAALRLRIVA
jgi:ActR/RegA family two-component response regulator